MIHHMVSHYKMAGMNRVKAAKIQSDVHGTKLMKDDNENIRQDSVK